MLSMLFVGLCHALFVVLFESLQFGLNVAFKVPMLGSVVSTSFNGFNMCICCCVGDGLSCDDELSCFLFFLAATFLAQEGFLF